MEYRSDVVNSKMESERIRKILRAISKNGVGEILYCLKKSPKKFTEIMFETRLNSSVVWRHLKSLMELKAVSKNGEHYYLTETGMVFFFFFEKIRCFEKDIENSDNFYPPF